MPWIWLYTCILGFAVEQGHQEWLLRLQQVYHLRWRVMTQPASAIREVCELVRSDVPHWIQCQQVVKWKKQGEWTLACFDYATGAASFSPRHYLIQLHCTWMSIALPRVEVRVFR